MANLRQRMIEDLQLRGMSQRTQEMYVRAVWQLAKHYHKSPEKITEEDLRSYFLYIKNVKKEEYWCQNSLSYVTSISYVLIFSLKMYSVAVTLVFAD